MFLLTRTFHLENTMRHAIPSAMLATLALALLPATAQAKEDASPLSPSRQTDSAATLDGWTSSGGYAGVSGGLVFGADRSDWSTVDNHDLRYSDDVSVDNGWQTTVEGGVIIPLGRLDWMRLRAGGELGYSNFDLDTQFDTFSGDTVSGDVRMLRVGPAAALDFRIPRSRFSFTAGVGVGAAFLDMDASVSNGGSARDAGKHQTTAYLSGLVAVNYAIDPNVDLSLGYRSIWLDNARINGTTTGSYEVRHNVNNVGALELGLRVRF